MVRAGAHCSAARRHGCGQVLIAPLRAGQLGAGERSHCSRWALAGWRQVPIAPLSVGMGAGSPHCSAPRRHGCGQRPLDGFVFVPGSEAVHNAEFVLTGVLSLMTRTTSHILWEGAQGGPLSALREPQARAAPPG